MNSDLIRGPIRKYGWLFLLPTFAAFCRGFLWPFVQGIYLSFCNFNVPSDAKWIGIGNYIKVFKDAGFRNAFKNTAAFAIVTIVIINVISFSMGDTALVGSAVIAGVGAGVFSDYREPIRKIMQQAQEAK